MTIELNLGEFPWTLDGFMPNEPLIPFSGIGPLPDAAVPALPARVPGSVHDDLRAAGMLPDWNVGLNSNQCEWVNNRHWRYRCTLHIPASWQDRSIVLCADGLDHSGWICVDGRRAGQFDGALKRHEVDLSSHLRPGQTAELAIVFDPSPRIPGNCGYTSKITQIKPRFGYGWDWCAPLVNIGIWDALTLRARASAHIKDLIVTSDLDESLRTGLLKIRGRLAGPARETRLRFQVIGDDGNGKVILDEVRGGQANLAADISLADVRPWWPAHLGDQPLYRLRIELLASNGQVLQCEQRTVGFRRIRWSANAGAPPGAAKYVCRANDRPVFLKGINWVPLSPFYGSVSRDQYEARLRQYVAMNVNVLRVWGGGPLERFDLYDLCDRLGLLVWQEFPLSSSLLENWPPETPEVVDELARVALDYVQRRAHHASLTVWCGGNELQGSLDGSKSGQGKPVDLAHPCIARFAALLSEHDPARAFFPTSPSGPRFEFNNETRGKGLHHDVHGPWKILTRAALAAYWNDDDSLLRSEVGAPGMARSDAIVRHAGQLPCWPPDMRGLYWTHHARQWPPLPSTEADFGPWDSGDEAQLPQMVRCSQFAQAENYRYAIESCRRRTLACSGILLWMGHDLYQMASNNSVIEHDGVPKLACYAVGNAMAPLHISARFDSLVVGHDDPIRADVFAHADTPAVADGPLRWRVRLLDLSGRCLNEAQGDVRDAGLLRDGCSAARVASLQWSAPAVEEQLLIVRCELMGQAGRIISDYVISQQVRSHPLAPLRRLRKTRVASQWLGAPDRLVLHNEGSTAAVGLWPADGSAWVPRDPWPIVLLPDESATVRIGPLGGAGLDQPMMLDGLNLL